MCIPVVGCKYTYLYITSRFLDIRHTMYTYINKCICIVYIPFDYIYWLVVSTPLKNMKVSWDYDIPNI